MNRLISSRSAVKALRCTVAVVAFVAGIAGARPVGAVDSAAMHRGATDRITSSVPIFDQLLIFGIPRGWRPAYENVDKRKYILEFVPDGQNVKSWHEMITVQGFRDAALNSDLAPRLFLVLTARRMKDLCGDSTVTLWLGARTVDSFDAHAAILGCANLPTSPRGGVQHRQGEVAYYLAIKGARDLYVIQRAMRGKAFDPANPPINSDNVAELVRTFEPIRLCNRDFTPAQCWSSRNGPASNEGTETPGRDR